MNLTLAEWQSRSPERRSIKAGPPCCYCGRTTLIIKPLERLVYLLDLQEERRRRTREHVIPLSRGGTNSPDNVKSACERCNSEKGNRTPEEWIKRWYRSETVVNGHVVKT